MNLTKLALTTCENLRKSRVPQRELYTRLIESIINDPRFCAGIEHTAVRYLVGNRKIVVNYSFSALEDLLNNCEVLISKWSNKKEK
jgi:hypothetical protein